jgi:hypothetical protein
LIILIPVTAAVAKAKVELQAVALLLIVHCGRRKESEGPKFRVLRKRRGELSAEYRLLQKGKVGKVYCCAGDGIPTSRRGMGYGDREGRPSVNNAESRKEGQTAGSEEDGGCCGLVQGCRSKPRAKWERLDGARLVLGGGSQF